MYHEHGAALWSKALRLTGGDRGRAEDAVQEVLFRAWRHPESMDPSRGSPRGWLLRTLNNLLIDEWRARSVRPETIVDELPEQPGADEGDAAIQSWLMEEALRKLSPAQRDVIVEFFYRGTAWQRWPSGSAYRKEPSSRARTTRCASYGRRCRRWG